jgi:hypothetical protein
MQQFLQFITWRLFTAQHFSGVLTPETCWAVNKLEKLLHLVGWFIWIVWCCMDLQTLKFQCGFLQPPLTFSHLSPNVFLRTLFLNTLSQCSSCNVRDRVSHLHTWNSRLYYVSVYWSFNLCVLISQMEKNYSGPNGSRHSLNSICP